MQVAKYTWQNARSKLNYLGSNGKEKTDVSIYAEVRNVCLNVSIFIVFVSCRSIFAIKLDLTMHLLTEN
ncbi:hypothetical protein GCM10008107_23070 [Psychrosphaera saromensis]|nr:hypothetical protein GCM10008107_23070 [Psychrosphaera saromensis]GLQ13490.1 hypothetical protein GCM10007917_09450 [Psychrosphaera saromensis]